MLGSKIKSEASLWCQAGNKALARIIGVLAGGALIRNSLDCSLGSKMVHGIERKCHLRCVELIIFLLQNLDMSISVVILYSINRKVMQQLYLPCVLYHAHVCN
jgi:hypothetical protein